MTMRMPSASSAASASAASSLIGSAMAMTPDALPSMATNITVAPSLRSSSASRVRGSPTRCRARRGSAALPSATRRPSTMPIDALAGRRSRSPAAVASVDACARRRPRRSPRRADARCPLEAGGEPQHVGFVDACGRLDRDDLGLALGQGAGLVDDERVDLLQRSSASAFLISTPACAPRPTPTMIDIGVARPSAHGQAMISTETAATRP